MTALSGCLGLGGGGKIDAPAAELVLAQDDLPGEGWTVESPPGGEERASVGYRYLVDESNPLGPRAEITSTVMTVEGAAEVFGDAGDVSTPEDLAGVFEDRIVEPTQRKPGSFSSLNVGNRAYAYYEEPGGNLPTSADGGVVDTNVLGTVTVLERIDPIDDLGIDEGTVADLVRAQHGRWRSSLF